MVNKGGKFEQNSPNKFLMDTHKDGAFIFKSGFQPNIAHLFNSDFDNRGLFTEVMRYWPLKSGLLQYLKMNFANSCLDNAKCYCTRVQMLY